MRSIFLSHEQVFEKQLPIFKAVGTAAPASDLALLTTPDDGFLHEAEGGINYFLSDGCVDRFGRDGECGACALRPVLLLDEADNSYPAYLIDQSLRDMAEREFRRGALHDTGKKLHVGNGLETIYALGGKRLIRLTLGQGGAGGYVQLRDGTVVTEGESVFLEFRPVRWLYDASLGLLLSCQALFGGMDRDKAAAYLQEDFIGELGEESDDALPENAPFRVQERDELSLIRAYVEANIPVFLHGLSGDGKSDRVRQIDPQALDIELVNENPETINGRAVYNEAQDRIVDIKPVWLVKLERLCEDGELHILFFDELTNATKQTQSVIFKIVLERFVNNRWSLPPNARIVAIDLSAEWDTVMEPGSLVQGCVVARREFAEAHGAEIACFLEEYGRSVALLGEDPQTAAQKIEEAGIFANAAVAAKAIPRCNICFVTGEEMQLQLSAFLRSMFETAPQSVGGSVPGDDFYYEG